jgi:hypothetical protein
MDAHDAIPREGGTTYHFVTGGIESALEQARDAAGQMDVVAMGGAIRSAVRESSSARRDQASSRAAPYRIRNETVRGCRRWHDRARADPHRPRARHHTSSVSRSLVGRATSERRCTSPNSGRLCSSRRGQATDHEADAGGSGVDDHHLRAARASVADERDRRVDAYAEQHESAQDDRRPAPASSSCGPLVPSGQTLARGFSDHPDRFVART